VVVGMILVYYEVRLAADGKGGGDDAMSNNNAP